MRIVTAVAMALAILLVGASAATAGDPYYEDGALEDSVTGTDRPGGDRWVVDAHSDSRGGNPRGTLSLVGPGVVDPGPVADVTCLAVTGNRAVIGAMSKDYGIRWFWIVEDNGSGTDDLYGSVAGVAADPYSCTNPPVLDMFPLIAPDGDLVVADDRPVPVPAKSSRCAAAARKLTAARRKRCAKIRKAKASCIRKARKLTPKTKAERRVRACRRIAAARSRP